MANIKLLEVEKAEQQLTGFAHAKHGYGLTELISSMGLKEYEWNILKKDYSLTYLTADEIEEIGTYFKTDKTSRGV
jgi:hypothetical protein